MNPKNRVAGAEYGRAFAPSEPSRRPEADATLYETIRRATRQLLEAVLKWVGVTVLLVSCALVAVPRGGGCGFSPNVT